MYLLTKINKCYRRYQNAIILDETSNMKYVTYKTKIDEDLYKCHPIILNKPPARKWTILRTNYSTLKIIPHKKMYKKSIVQKQLFLIRETLQKKCCLLKKIRV